MPAGSSTASARPASIDCGQLQRLLESTGIAYVENPRLVRGLDYYNNCVFEWTTETLGAQGAPLRPMAPGDSLASSGPTRYGVRVAVEQKM